MGLTLTVDHYLHIKQSDDGARITDKQRFKKGDSLDSLPKAEQERLLAIGAASDGDEDGATENRAVQEALGTPAETSDFTGGSGEDFPDLNTDIEDEDEDEDGDDQSDSGDEVEEVDEYSEMSYADLQAKAKSRDLNGGGSADDLRARLREHDKANASGE